MTEVTLNQEDHSYMFDDETTPVKACSELGYQVITGFAFCFQVIISVLDVCLMMVSNLKSWVSGDTNKKLEVHSETRSALKRRRMLQFEDHSMETSLFSSENFSAILKSSVSIQNPYLVFSYSPYAYCHISNKFLISKLIAHSLGSIPSFSYMVLI